jgi:DNA-directed RNA polymerase subunit H (RpoH/RPB5)
VFYAFDVLSLNGRDLTTDPLTQRREQLQKIITADPVLRLSQDLPGSVADIIKTLRAAGVEGVIAKRRESPYQPGDRSRDWVKLKLERQQEFVIGGYSPDGAKSAVPAGRRALPVSQVTRSGSTGPSSSKIASLRMGGVLRSGGRSAQTLAQFALRRLTISRPASPRASSANVVGSGTVAASAPVAMIA